MHTGINNVVIESAGTILIFVPESFEILASGNAKALFQIKMEVVTTREGIATHFPGSLELRFKCKYKEFVNWTKTALEHKRLSRLSYASHNIEPSEFNVGGRGISFFNVQGMEWEAIADSMDSSDSFELLAFVPAGSQPKDCIEFV